MPPPPSQQFALVRKPRLYEYFREELKNDLINAKFAEGQRIFLTASDKDFAQKKQGNALEKES
jgi:hypothetical protein